MSTRKVSTTTNLENAAYPKLVVLWTEDEDGNGWSGQACIWQSGSDHDAREHTISLRQGIPLGRIYLLVDECSHGCWASTSFEGTGLAERDLQWAAAFAGLSIMNMKLSQGN